MKTLSIFEQDRPVRRINKQVCLLASVIGWGLSLPVLAEAPAGVLRGAVEAAWARTPETVRAAGAFDEAAARRDVAGQWISGAPSVTLSERSDRFDANRGRRSQEVELGLPLWRWGQRSAKSALADADLALAEAEWSMARWQVAGEVREAIWSAALSAAEFASARQRLAVMERVEREVAQHVAAGDLARADLLLASGERLAAQAATLGAEGQARGARQAFVRLTGLPEAWPDRLLATAADGAPVPPAANDLAGVSPSDHPRLQVVEARWVRAGRAGREVQASLNEAPELILGLERERDSRDLGNEGMVRIGIKIPFGGAAWNAPAAAAAGAATVRAEVDRQLERQRVDSEIALARAALEQAQQARDLLALRQQTADEHVGLLRRGFKLGEIGLADLLRGEAQAIEAQGAQQRQQLLVGQAASRLQHSLGQLP